MSFLSKAKSKVSGLIESERTHKRVKQDVISKIEQGQIKKQKDIGKYFTERGMAGRFAKETLKKQEIVNAREIAYHKEILKQVKENARKKAKEKFKPKRFMQENKNFNDMFMRL